MPGTSEISCEAIGDCNCDHKHTLMRKIKDVTLFMITK